MDLLASLLGVVTGLRTLGAANFLNSIFLVPGLSFITGQLKYEGGNELLFFLVLQLFAVSDNVMDTNLSECEHQICTHTHLLLFSGVHKLLSTIFWERSDGSGFDVAESSRMQGVSKITESSFFIPKIY